MDYEKTVKTWVNPTNQAKELTVVGNTPFNIQSSRFVISPLQHDTKIHVLSIHNGCENDKVLADINANEYTQISGIVPNITMFIDTEETFYIKF